MLDNEDNTLLDPEGSKQITNMFMVSSSHLNALPQIRASLIIARSDVKRTQLVHRVAHTIQNTSKGSNIVMLRHFQKHESRSSLGCLTQTHPRKNRVPNMGTDEVVLHLVSAITSM